MKERLNGELSSVFFFFQTFKWLGSLLSSPELNFFFLFKLQQRIKIYICDSSIKLFTIRSSIIFPNTGLSSLCICQGSFFLLFRPRIKLFIRLPRIKLFIHLSGINLFIHWARLIFPSLFTGPKIKLFILRSRINLFIHLPRTEFCIYLLRINALYWSAQNQALYSSIQV